MILTPEQEKRALVNIVIELGHAALDEIVGVFNSRYYQIDRARAKEILDFKCKGESSDFLPSFHVHHR